MCDQGVAMAANNREAVKDFRFICVPCYTEHFAETGKPGGLVGGLFYANLRTALLAAKAETQRN
jgi:hypothetical protein